MRSLRFGLDPKAPSFILVLSGAALLVMVVWGLGHWWRLRSEESVAREATLPACIARLAEEPKPGAEPASRSVGPRAEADCRELIAKNASDCVLVARHVKGRYEGGGDYFVQSEFDDCVVRGVNAILAENGERKSRQARERMPVPP